MQLDQLSHGMRRLVHRLSSPVPLVLALAMFLALFAGRASAQGEGPNAIAAAQSGTVYVMSNDAAGNSILAFSRAADGTLTPAGSFPTGGLGSGAGLGSQGAVILSRDGRFLFAVNAGSNEISSFRVRSGALNLVETVSSEGEHPISLTSYGRRLVVLNAGGSGNITAFTISASGGLRPIAGSTQPLSNGGVGAAPGPAQVSFSPNGRQLVVTEKATNMILTYGMTNAGLEPPVAHASAGQTPFGFAFGHRNTLIVSEAFGGAADASAVSSYQVGGGTVQNVTASAATNQTAACWVVVTGNGNYAYTTNAGSGSVSGYAVARDGRLTLLDADGRTGVTGAGSTPIDAALSSHSQYLYVLNAGAHTISAFAVGSDGSLAPLGDVSIPTGSVGVAAR